MALSGLGLVGFVVMHLLGNLTLLAPQPGPFNEYAHKLESLGPLLWVAEIGLIGIFVLHIVMAIWTTSTHRVARPIAYQNAKSKGGPTKNTVLSRRMIVSGTLLLAFVIFHVNQFKFGPGIAQGYVTQIKGETARDLYRHVFQSFQSPWTVGVYVAAMLFLGMHLRHGFWSAFQSLGVAYPKYSKCIYVGAWFIAAALTLGFLLLPIYLHFDLGGLLR